MDKSGAPSTNPGGNTAPIAPIAPIAAIAAMGPAMQGGLEILRRLLCLGLLLLAAWCFLTPAERILRVSLPDLRAKYERDAALVGESAPGFGDWLEKTLEGRTLAVSGPAWAEMAATLQSLTEQGNGAQPAASAPVVPANLAPHLDRDGAAFWFAADDALVRPLPLPGETFRYLLPKDSPQARPLGAAFEEPRHARTAPESLRYPHAFFAPWLLLAALAVYLLPPRPAKHPDAARYGAASAVVLPDLLGLGLTLFFFSLPLLIVGSTTSPDQLLSFERGWGFLTLAFWGLALLSAFLPATAAHYTCFEARAGQEGLTIRTLWSVRRIAYKDIREARKYDGAKRAQLLSRLLLIFGGGMPQTLGMALLLTRNVEWGLELVLADHVGTEGKAGNTSGDAASANTKPLRLMLNSLRNAGPLLESLAGAGVAVPAELRRACQES